MDTASTTRLLGLFAGEGFERPFSPTLAEMTQVAIEILSQDEDGFFLMVEGGQIDWAGHDNDPEGVFESMAGFDAAVVVGQAYIQNETNIFMIVTADHETGGMSVYFESTGNFREDGPFEIPDGTLFYVTWETTSRAGVDAQPDEVLEERVLPYRLSSEYTFKFCLFGLQTQSCWIR